MPEWKDAPDAPGLWIYKNHLDMMYLINVSNRWLGEPQCRYFGPIAVPPDTGSES